MIQRQIETPWGIFSVEDTGGAKPPVVLLHGGASNLRAWDNVIPGLSETRRCICFDLPGHGLTAIDPLDFAHLRQALSDAWMSMNVARPIIIGHSFGGLVAAFIGNTPDLVSGVMAIDPYLSDKEVRRNFKNVDEALEEIRSIHWPWPDTTDVDETVERVLKSAYKPRPDEDNLRAMIHRGYRAVGGGWFRRFPRREDEMKGVEANWSVNVLNTFKAVTCPLSIIIATSIPAKRLDTRRELVREIQQSAGRRDSSEFDCEHDVPGYMPDPLARYIGEWADSLA